MSTIEINDLDQDMIISDEDMNHVKGGVLIGLLLPAVQKVRVGSRNSPDSFSWGASQDGT